MASTPASPTPQILPSLPVKNSVLRQLNIADNALPHGVAHLKHKLLLSPFHTGSQESNICANSDFSGPRKSLDHWVLEFRQRLEGTIAKSSDPIETFKSLSYLDQIAFVCLAAGWRDCRAPNCLQYQSKLERVVPECDSWPGLRDFVLCITSCSLSAADKGRNETKSGLDDGWVDDNLLWRFRNHITACIVLTLPDTALLSRMWDITGGLSELYNLEETDESDSIGSPRSGASGPWGRDAIESHPPPAPRPRIDSQTFHPSPVDVAEVFHLVAWFRSISVEEYTGHAVGQPFWHCRDFIPVVRNAAAEASRKIVGLGFCQKRVWEIVRHGHEGETELVPLVCTLKHLPQLRHKGHESCTPAFCGDAIQNSTNVKQLHTCPDSKNCGSTDRMFNQELLVAALNNRATTTAWTLDGKSLVAKDRSFLAVSHVWADGTGNGTWEAGQVNKCLWGAWVKIAQALNCDGVWWDTTCIPRDKATRAKALNNMHSNYQHAKCTVVHDKYLAGIEWKDDGSPCIALVLSPWFTRGWTALELLLSERVFVLFRKGDGYTLKDLDQDILANHRFLHSYAHWIATKAVERLRSPYQSLANSSDLLSVLQSRYTSWPQDQSIIAGLMCGLTKHVTLSEQEATKLIILKLQSFNQTCLLHGQPTMSEPQWSWCPPRFGDLVPGDPTPGEVLVPGGLPNTVSVKPDGTLFGLWDILYIPPEIDVDGGVIRPVRAHMSVENQVRVALQEPNKCFILTCPSFDSQGLLVKLKAPEQATKLRKKIYCQYIGGVNFNPSEIRQHRRPISKKVYIGYVPGMVDARVVDWK